MLRLFSFLLVVGLSCVGQGLVWDKDTIVFKAKPGDTETNVDFAFTNKGKRPLRIRRVRTSCGCTAAQMSKDVFEPGEKGTLSVTFRFEGRTGKQLKTIFVTTDDPDKPTTHVELTGTLPWNLQISERLLLWPKGSEATPKTVLVEVNQNVDMKLTEVELDNRSFSCSMEPTDVARQYRLVFTPGDTGKPVRAAATLKTTPALNQAETARCRIFLYVR
jgi:hypothetical protein